MNDAIIVAGTKEQIIYSLREYGDNVGIELFLTTIEAYANNRNYNCINVRYTINNSIHPNTLQYIVFNAKYYINLKKTTFALLLFLLDLKISSGFLSTIYSTFIAGNLHIIKLDNTNGMRCTLIETALSSSQAGDSDRMLWHVSEKCRHNGFSCTLRQDNRCLLTKKIIEINYKKFVELGIFSQDTEGVYRYNI